jgi:hypothetical protein
MNISAISTAPGRNGNNQLEECRREAAKNTPSKHLAVGSTTKEMKIN